MRRDASLCSDDFDDARVALDVLLPAVDDKRVSLVVARWRVGHQRVRALLIVGDVGAVGGDMGGVGRVVLAGTARHQADARDAGVPDTLRGIERVRVVALPHQREQVPAQHGQKRHGKACDADDAHDLDA